LNKNQSTMKTGDIVKGLDFSGTTIYCGVDVHKKSWRVNIQDDEFELEDFTQNPDAVLLHKHLSRRYPGASFKIGYEAGFSGFGAQRMLQGLGNTCVVINAADIPTSDKEKRQKQDKGDARKLCHHLQSKKMKSIYVPEAEWEHARTLVRTRERIVNNQTRCKNRIWQLLHFSGLAVPAGHEEGSYWSKRFISTLQQMDCGGSIHLKQSLDLHIKDYLQTRQLLLEATRAIRKLCRETAYKEDIELLQSIPGIGEINAAVMLFELQDIKRFKRFDHLCSYVGLVPDTEDSGEAKRSKGITHRHNHYLRTALVESCWSVVRKDPALLMKYKEYCKRMEKNKAIIRIAKHLLARVNYVLKNKKKYVTGVVA
jgi:transposase